jgi:hypothetical protein
VACKQPGDHRWLPKLDTPRSLRGMFVPVGGVNQNKRTTQAS